MGKKHNPRRGSLAYYPRKRAKKICPRVRTRIKSKEVKIGEFAGYKVGMTSISIINDKKGSPTYNQEIVVPVTVLETPPLKVCALRAYKDSKVKTEVWIKELDKELERKIRSPKKQKSSIEKLEKEIEECDDVRLIAHTQPIKAGIHKKKPEIFELAVLGENLEEKFKFAKENLGKEISIRNVFKNGEFVDVAGITKGKGFQGSVKRFGIKRLSHKAQKIRRKAGNLGPWHPHKTRWTVPQMGQMGFHQRSEYNKRILFIGEELKDINKNGWKYYGLVKNNYILIKGSIQGPSKRLIRIKSSIRPSTKLGEPVIGKIMVK